MRHARQEQWPHQEEGRQDHGSDEQDPGASVLAPGSQGEQRLALLSLLLAERAALAQTRAAMPLMLLDDVMSELDPDRRAMLADLLRGDAAFDWDDLFPAGREAATNGFYGSG